MQTRWEGLKKSENFVDVINGCPLWPSVMQFRPCVPLLFEGPQEEREVRSAATLLVGLFSDVWKVEKTLTLI